MYSLTRTHTHTHEMSIRHSKVDLTKPLEVAIVTWNVGNEEPFVEATVRNSIGALIPQAYDVLAVGVQECTYKVGAKKGSASDDKDEYCFFREKILEILSSSHTSSSP